VTFDREAFEQAFLCKAETFPTDAKRAEKYRQLADRNALADALPILKDWERAIADVAHAGLTFSLTGGDAVLAVRLLRKLVGDDA
jgi:hypothetical protein